MSMSLAESGVNYHYVQGALDKSVELSKKIYEKTGLKSDLIEGNAKKINDLSTQVAQIIDNQIDATVNRIQVTKKNIVEKTNKTKQDFIERTSQTKKNLLEKTMNLTLVKKADDFGNNILTELEQQVNLLALSINKKLNVSDSKEDIVLTNPSAEEGKLSLSERTTRLVLTLNKLGKQIADSYLAYLKSTALVQSAQQKYAFVDAKAKDIRINIEAFAEVLLGTVIQKNIVLPLMSQLKVKYTQSKESVTVVIQNIKKLDVQNVLAFTKNQYESLLQSTMVIIKGDKLSFTFALDYFNHSLQNIQKEIAQLLTDVNALRARSIESAMELYKLAIDDFKNRKQQKHALTTESFSSPKEVDEL